MFAYHVIFDSATPEMDFLLHHVTQMLEKHSVINGESASYEN
jgi:hypothetical protein